MPLHERATEYFNLASVNTVVDAKRILSDLWDYFASEKHKSQESPPGITDLAQRSDQWSTKSGFLRIPGIILPLKTAIP